MPWVDAPGLDFWKGMVADETMKVNLSSDAKERREVREDVE